MLYDLEPKGYYIQRSETIPYPSEEVIRKLKSDYHQLKRNPRPPRKASEKDALRSFKQMKRLRPEQFNKGLAKEIRDTLVETPYGPLSYYSISDGGDLSDEYEFLSYSESVKETREYTMKNE